MKRNGKGKRRAAAYMVILLFLAFLSAGPARETAKAVGYGIQNPRISEDGVTTWDCVYFGNYWQYDTDGDGRADEQDEKVPIKWRVLSVDGYDAFLMADQCLETVNFWAGSLVGLDKAYCWDSSPVRQWLNGTFFDAAFSDGEKCAVRTMIVANEDNPEYNTDGGEDTEDNIYLLSFSEAKNPAYGFSENIDAASGTREAGGTDYIRTPSKNSAPGASMGAEYGSWALRTPGAPGYVLVVDDKGSVSVTGSNSNGEYRIRPVLHLDLRSTAWRGAGTADSIRGGDAASPQLSSPEIDTATGVVTYDCVHFGKYWQNDTNGDGLADEQDEKEPVKWMVLSVDGEDAFLMADRCLDCKEFNEERYVETAWEGCTLRQWLNGYFYDTVFDEAEKEAVRTTVVSNQDNPPADIDNRADTEDKIYLPSASEMLDPAYGFPVYTGAAEIRGAEVTEYTLRTGHTRPGSYDYWLRTMSDTSKSAACAGHKGAVYQDGNAVWSDTAMTIRPVLHLDLSKDVWDKAGTQTASIMMEGEEYRTADPPVVSQDRELHNPKTDEEGVTTWDCVYLGNYYQNNCFEREPIRWRVLSVDGTDAFLLSDKGLDAQLFWDYPAMWKNSSVRAWLNGEFYGTAFSEEEKGAVRTVLISNEDNPEYHTDGGEDTEDKICLLSASEVMNPAYGFYSMKGESATRQLENTVFAAKQAGGNICHPAGSWRLRTPGVDSGSTMYVDKSGVIYNDGTHMAANGCILRPALYLDLSSSVWTKAGTVNSLGESSGGTEPAVPTVSPAPTASPVPTKQPAPSVSPVPVLADTGKNHSRPGTVTGVKGSCTKENRVKLSWKGQEQVKNYRILRSGKKNKGYKQIRLLSGKKTTYTDKTVKKGKTYYYKVIPVYTDGASGKEGRAAAVKVMVYALDRPVMRLFRGRTETGQKYVKMVLRRYEGSYAEIYVKYKGKYQRLYVRNKKISFFHGRFIFRFQKGGRTVRFKVRTYRKKNGKRQYSMFTEVKKIKI